MIKCNMGTAEFEGDALQLSAETTTILSGLLETYSKNESSIGDRQSHNFLLKSIIYAFTRDAMKKGYDTHFTDEELDNFDRVYREVYDDGKD